MHLLRIILASVTLMIVESQPLEIFNYKTEFWLYTKGRKGREALFTNDRNSILNSNFKPCRKTAFVITGWFQPRGDLRLITFAETLASQNWNAFVVDYYTFDFFLSPLIAGNDIAKFMEALVDVTGYDPKNIQLFGISLGTHVAGQASRKFRIGRITALDPTGFFYELLPRFFRVDTTDADFVEVIHTSFFFGSVNPYIGHVNYIINDALTQPGCPEYDENLEFCYHLRASYFYLASLTKCTAYFKECGSYIAFKLGLCRDKPNLLFGFPLDPDDAPRSGRLYWYSTKRDVYPFCERADQITPRVPSNICRRRNNRD